MASKKVKADQEPEVEFVIANDLRVGGYVMLRGKDPSKIVELHKSQEGKHGSCKIRAVGLNMFSGKKSDDLFGSTDRVTVPVVKKIDYELLYVMEDNYLKLCRAGETREDMKMDERDKVTDEIVELISEQDDSHAPPVVTVISAMNREKVLSVKAGKKIK